MIPLRGNLPDNDIFQKTWLPLRKQNNPVCQKHV